LCRTVSYCDVHSLIAKELEYIPKIILLQKFKNYIDQLWDKLSEHIKADSEVQQHRRCLKHCEFTSLRTSVDEGTEKTKKNKKKIKKMIKMGTITNAELQQLTKLMRIPYFRGIFMRTTLPTGGVYRNERSNCKFR